jgi:hypothetical protein
VRQSDSIITVVWYQLKQLPDWSALPPLQTSLVDAWPWQGQQAALPSRYKK